MVIGHPRPLAAEGLARILSSGGYRISGRAEDAEGIVELALSAMPEVVFLDSSLVTPDAALVKKLVDGRELLVVLMIGESRPEALVMDAMAAGARGCVSFDDSSHQFLSALELMVQGALVVTPACTKLVFKEPHTRADPAGVLHLSGREVQVATLIGRGSTNEEISDELSISVHTVKIHVGSILTKLNLRNRHQIAAYVAHFGLLNDIQLQDRES